MIAQTVSLMRGGSELAASLPLVESVLIATAAIVAVACGIVGLAQRGRPRALAGIGLGAGALALLNLTTWSLIYPFLLSTGLRL